MAIQLGSTWKWKADTDQSIKVINTIPYGRYVVRRLSNGRQYNVTEAFLRSHFIQQGEDSIPYPGQ